MWDPPHVSMEQAVKRLAAVGFQVLDFNIQDWLFDGSPAVGDDWQRWVRRAGKAARDVGVVFNQAHMPLADPRETKTRKRRLENELAHRSIEAAGMLGVPWIACHALSFAGAWDQGHLDELRERNLEYFAPFLKTAEKAGVGLAMENLADAFSEGARSRTYTATPGELIDLVDAFDHPLVGILWDTGHAHLQGLDQGQALRAIGSRLKGTHIADNDGRWDQHLMPFLGKVDWKAVMEALWAIDYAGDFTYEIHNYVRHLPDPLRDGAARVAFETAEWLLAGKWEKTKN